MTKYMMVSHVSSYDVHSKTHKDERHLSISIVVYCVIFGYTCYLNNEIHGEFSHLCVQMMWELRSQTDTVGFAIKLSVAADEQMLISEK